MTKSLCIKGWSLQLCQCLRNFLNMNLWVYTFENLSNLALRIDDERHSPGQPIKGQRTVSSRDFLGWIRKDWKVQFEFLRKTLMRITVIDADAKHLDFECCQPCRFVSKAASFASATGRFVLRVKIQHDPSTGKVTQENQVAVLVLQFEFRRGIADLQCGLIKHSWLVASDEIPVANTQQETRAQ